MTKTKKLIAILVVVAMLFTFVAAVAACVDPEPDPDPTPTPTPTPTHTCGHVCSECGKCEDPTCTDPVCAAKCEGHAVGEKGTEGNPYTVAEAIEAGMELGSGNYSEGEVYVKGFVVGSVTGPSSGEYNFNISDEAGKSEAVVVVWWASSTDKPYENDFVTIRGYLQNYTSGNTTKIETSKDKSSTKGTHAIENIIRGTSSITVAENEHVTVDLNGVTSGKNGSTFTFKVSVDSAWKLSAVKVNGAIVEADESDVYTGTVQGNTEITVDIVEASAKTYVWKQVTSLDMLTEDSLVIFACQDEGALVGSLHSNGYLNKVDFTFGSDKSTINALPDGVVTFTLGKSDDNWTFSNGGKLLGATAAKKLALDGSGTTTWTITITDGVIKITSTETSYGWIQFNKTSPRFLNYASSQTAIQLYIQQVAE